jgi:hypothetical protein
MLDRLLRYATEAARAARIQGDDAIKAGARGYVGGALTTLRGFGHISEEEESEWGSRLLAALGDDPDSVMPTPR